MPPGHSKHVHPGKCFFCCFFLLLHEINCGLALKHKCWMKLKFWLVSPVKHLMIVFSLMFRCLEGRESIPFSSATYPFFYRCLPSGLYGTTHRSLQHCAGHPEATLYLHNPQLPQDIFLTGVLWLGSLDLTYPTWSPSVLRVKMLLQGEEEACSEMFIITVKWQVPFLSPPFPCHGDSDLCCGPCCFLFPVLI